jgi:hypothetical protein
LKEIREDLESFSTRELVGYMRRCASQNIITIWDTCRGVQKDKNSNAKKIAPPLGPSDHIEDMPLRWLFSSFLPHEEFLNIRSEELQQALYHIHNT